MKQAQWHDILSTVIYVKYCDYLTHCFAMLQPLELKDK